MSIGPTIEVHTICWNEESLLPLFLSHYSSFATKIVVWDNHSDDASQDLVRECERAELQTYDSENQSSNDRYLDVKNHCWKETQADWVIVCDIDELIYHPDLLNLLTNSTAQILKCDGFNVTGPSIDRTPRFDVWKGKHAPQYCKPAVFRASIGEIRYAYGCHTARPQFPIEPSEIKLLHCQFLRSVDDLIDRYRRLAARKSPRDFKRGLSYHYMMTDERIRNLYRSVSDYAYPFPVIDDVRRIQGEGATWEQVAMNLRLNQVDPPKGRLAWTPRLVRDVFGRI